MSARHHFSIADATLQTKVVELDHPKPTGLQLLEAAGRSPPDGHILLAVLPNGDFEEVGLAEHVPNHGPEASRSFIAFQSDRLYRFTLDGRQMAWGEPRISGAVLTKLLGATDPDKDIVLRNADGTEKIIGPNDHVRLDDKGTEQLVTRVRSYVIFINGKRKTTTKSSLTFEELITLAFENPPTGDGVQFTIQFTRGPEANPSGTLLEGQSVAIKNGIEFDVTPTNRS